MKNNMKKIRTFAKDKDVIKEYSYDNINSINFRQTNYDFLRAISCYTVVLLHIATMYVKDDFRYIVGNNNYIIASLFSAITQLGVPCFVMLSGAFLLKNPQNKNFYYFYTKSLHKIGIPIIIFSILYVLLHYAEGILGGSLKENYTFYIYEPLINWFRGIPNVTMWYMYMIIPIYLITPFLIIIKSEISKQNWYILSGIMMLYSILVAYTCTLSWILQFAKWIGYFLIGDIISDLANNKVDIKISRHPLICIVSSYLILFFHWYMFSYRVNSLSLLSSLSPLCVIASALLFMGFAYIHTANNILVKLISRYSFFIYLIHPFICEIIMQLLGRVLKWFPTAYLIPLYAACVTIGCLFLSIIIFKIINNSKIFLKNDI